MKYYSPTGRRNHGYVRPERVNKWPNTMMMKMRWRRKRRKKDNTDLAKEHKLIFPSESYAIRRESH